MAKRKATRRASAAARGRKRTSGRSSGARISAKKAAGKRVAARKTPKRASVRKAARPMSAAARPEAGGIRAKTPRLDRVRRTLDETVPTPPSSLDMDRHSSAARTGHEELADNLRKHQGMSPEITSGDLDVDVEDAYFTGEESPGGDNTTPDQDIVDNIGRALGVEYEDNEELKASDKVTERDKHRWELDPASSEDYKDRK